MLSMAICCAWRDVIHGAMLLALIMMICYPWREVVHGDMLSMAICCPWRYVIHGDMLSMARCYPWRDVIYGAMLWRDVIYGKMLLSLFMTRWYPTYQNHLSHHPRFCYHVPHPLMYSAIMAMFSVVDDDVHFVINANVCTYVLIRLIKWIWIWICLRGHQLSAECDLAIHCLTIRHRRTRLKWYIILVIWHFGR